MTIEQGDAERRALRRRRQMRQVLGALVCVLVIVGVVSVFSGIFKLGARMFDDTEEKKSYEARLSCLVALDPVPFASLETAPVNTLLDAAIWQTIDGTNSQDYEHDEVGAMYLPTADIDKIVTELYGPNFKFNYQTFEDRGLTYNYVPEKEAYLVPITSAASDYQPQVEKIKREGNTKRVTVGYVSPYTESGAINLTGVYTPVKYNDYIFTKIDGVYYLSAIVASEMKVEASSSSASASVSVDPQLLLEQNAPLAPEEASSVPEDAASAAGEAGSEAAAG